MGITEKKMETVSKCDTTLAIVSSLTGVIYQIIWGSIIGLIGLLRNIRGVDY